MGTSEYKIQSFYIIKTITFFYYYYGDSTFISCGEMYTNRKQLALPYFEGWSAVIKDAEERQYFSP